MRQCFQSLIKCDKKTHSDGIRNLWRYLWRYFGFDAFVDISAQKYLEGQLKEHHFFSSFASTKNQIRNNSVIKRFKDNFIFLFNSIEIPTFLRFIVVPWIWRNYIVAILSLEHFSFSFIIVSSFSISEGWRVALIFIRRQLFHSFCSPWVFLAIL